MQIDVLGCAGGIDRHQRTTTFLLDGDTLIDAGTGVYDLPLQVQYGIEQVFITHAHFDHVAGLPFLADSVARYRAENGLGPIKVHALPSVLHALQQHLFNNTIWPDFACLPSVQAPTLTWVPLQTGAVVALPGERTVEALPAMHSVPAVGYAIAHQQRAWVFTGDTGRNACLWPRLNAMQEAGIAIDALVAEVTFTNAHQDFADLTGHLTAASLAQELQQLQHGDIDLYLTHLKPADEAGIAAELADLRRAAQARNCRIHVLPRHHVFRVPAKHAQPACAA